MSRLGLREWDPELKKAILREIQRLRQQELALREA